MLHAGYRLDPVGIQLGSACHNLAPPYFISRLRRADEIRRGIRLRVRKAQRVSLAAHGTLAFASLHPCLRQGLILAFGKGSV